MSDDDILVVFRRYGDTDDGGVDDIRDRAREQDLGDEELEHASLRVVIRDYDDVRWGVDVDE